MELYLTRNQWNTNKEIIMAAVTFTLIFYLILWIAFYGWGRVALTIFGISTGSPKNIAMAVWLGWASTLFLFQVLHFFVPIKAYSVVPIFTIGIVVAILYSAPKIYDSFRFPLRLSIPIRIVLITIAVLGIASWITAKAMLTPTHYDSGLHHFNIIRWINTYAIVPGLGNLHGRLAFNQSFFTYVAALNFYPYFGHGRSLANSFLLLLVIATLAPSITSIIRQPSLLFETHPFRYASDLFILPVVFYLTLSSNGLASPSPDLTSTLLQLVIFTVLVHGIAEWTEGQKKQNFRAVFLVIMATTAVTIKLSNLAFSASIIGFAIIYTWQNSRPRIRGLVSIFLPATIITLVWLLRGFILSGAPLYPSTIGYISIDWAVPINEVINMANWVFSWARQPRTHWSNVLGSWNWFEPWISNILKSNSERWFVLYPLFFSIVVFTITLVIRYLKKLRAPQYVELAVLIPLIVGLVYWFFTAPNPRFAHALFYLLSISSILLFFLTVQHVVDMKKFGIIVFILFLVGSLPFLRYGITNIKKFKYISLSGWHAVRTVSLEKKITASGLAVYTPTNGDQCWDSPLPSTPYFNKSLRLRASGDIGSGFTVKEQVPDQYDAEQDKD